MVELTIVFLSAILIISLIIFLMRRNPELVEPAPVELSGNLTYGGVPVEGAAVTLYNAEGGIVTSTISGVNGAFALPAVTPGNYHVTAIKANPDGTHLQADVDVILDVAKSVDLAMVSFFVSSTVSALKSEAWSNI